MSGVASPYPGAGAGYASSPYHHGSASPAATGSARPTPPGSKPGSSRSTPKPVNVFTNDGSFLERVQRSKKLTAWIFRKKHFDDRFRNRGKRRAQPEVGTEEPSAKKPKPSDASTEAEYGKQLRSLEHRDGMKDSGSGSSMATSTNVCHFLKSVPLLPCCQS
ncbi:hypothetical protein H0H93_013377 [Arthromyces matolae]|nr:hypothetical protein H0H93_013377 [Arthromyces matolae]